jgi:hypothetical protein
MLETEPAMIMHPVWIVLYDVACWSGRQWRRVAHDLAAHHRDGPA